MNYMTSYAATSCTGIRGHLAILISSEDSCLTLSGHLAILVLWEARLITVGSSRDLNQSCFLLGLTKLSLGKALKEQINDLEFEKINRSETMEFEHLGEGNDRIEVNGENKDRDRVDEKVSLVLAEDERCDERKKGYIPRTLYLRQKQRKP
ncbi:hypothetical protein SASPL_125543 [Salvia splendens]|uniref:Uncharacterized protein n=1 Tax=Salvia splendens TaxID=180675 RepID=A0A8X8XFF2_SALSN|nr:hypothetical protein SASPL_125543 [Salvia splendens]